MLLRWVDTLKAAGRHPTHMRVTVDVAGEGTHECDVDEDATYADLLADLEYSPHEVSVLVDDRPVPEDQPISAERVRVVRLIKGG